MSRRVLVVDDEPDVLLAMRLLLQGAGYSVLGARDGRGSAYAGGGSQVGCALVA
jgi:CheY-like chemotaxis protein